MSTRSFREKENESAKANSLVRQDQPFRSCFSIFFPVRISQRSHNMVSPGTIEKKIIFGESFFNKTETFQKPSAAFIYRHIVGHDPMQIHDAKHIVNACAHRFR